jgi:hypothetical protein
MTAPRCQAPRSKECAAPIKPEARAAARRSTRRKRRGPETPELTRRAHETKAAPDMTPTRPGGRAPARTTSKDSKPGALATTRDSSEARRTKDSKARAKRDARLTHWRRIRAETPELRRQKTDECAAPPIAHEEDTAARTMPTRASPHPTPRCTELTTRRAAHTDRKHERQRDRADRAKRAGRIERAARAS